MDKIKQYEKELEDTIKAMNQTKEQINILNKKGEELAAHATYLNGKIDAYKEMSAKNV